MTTLPPQVHDLRVLPAPDHTVGVCICGWRREVTTETVAITGRSREEALRAAYDEHVTRS